MIHRPFFLFFGSEPGNLAASAAFGVTVLALSHRYHLSLFRRAAPFLPGSIATSPLSRHVAHSPFNSSIYTKQFDLKLILTSCQASEAKIDL